MSLEIMANHCDFQMNWASYHTVIEATSQFAKFAKGFVYKHGIFHDLPMFDNI